MPGAVRTARNPRATCRCTIGVYRLTDNLSGPILCKVPFSTAAEWVEQGHARWCKDGKAIQQAEAIVDPFGTRSALSRADRALTSADCMANAGAEESDDRIAAARCKVQAWLLVADGKVVPRAPLPNEPGGIRQISREELERLSSGTGPVFVGSANPVDHLVRMNRRITTRLLDNDSVRQEYEDFALADELRASESLSSELGDHLVDETDLGT